MKIKLATNQTPLFNHEGLALTESWSEVDTEDLSPAALDTIERYTGSIIRIHPDDESKFVASTGLDFHEGKFRYAGDPDASKDKPEIGKRHQIEAGTIAAPVTADAPVKATAATPNPRADEPTAVQPQPVTTVPIHEIASSSSSSKKSHR